jgi:prepilin-type N-terminal cleavage/methylation domain-containing protein
VRYDREKPILFLQRRRPAFTLVELLVVTALIVLVLSLVIPTL